MKSRPRGRKAGRTIRYVKADGTVEVYQYGPHKPKPLTRPTDTLEALVEAYRRSPEWDALAARTRRNYAIYLRELERVGHVPVASVQRRDILAARDAILNTRGPGAAQSFIRAVSAAFKFAVDREWIDHSPCTQIKTLPTGELRPWTSEQADLATAQLPEHLRRVVILARYTGQRRGDLCAMTWAAFDGERIKVVQQKTGTELVVPCHPVLKAELLRWKQDARGETILTNKWGHPWTGERLSHSMPDALARLGLPDDLNVHGLRKLAATELADAGCTTHQIAAVTGHKTLAMVQHYTRSVDQAQLAEAAIMRLQNSDKTKLGPEIPVKSIA